MLVGNQSVFHKWPGEYLGGTTTAGAGYVPVRTGFHKLGVGLNPFIFSQRASVPDGYNVEASLRISIKDGNLSAFTTIEGVGEVTGALTLAKLAEAALSGSGSITEADLASLVPLTSALAGSGSITEAAIQAVSAVEAALSGSGVVSQAQMSATVPLEAGLAGVGTVANTTNLTGTGRIEASILPFTELSPQALALSLLDSEDIETDFSLREALRLILAASAGEISGAETSTITIRDVNDTKDRIVASVDSDGNRISLTYDTSE